MLQVSVRRNRKAPLEEKKRDERSCRKSEAMKLEAVNSKPRTIMYSKCVKAAPPYIDGRQYHNAVQIK